MKPDKILSIEQQAQKLVAISLLIFGLLGMGTQLESFIFIYFRDLILFLNILSRQDQHGISSCNNLLLIIY